MQLDEMTEVKEQIKNSAAETASNIKKLLNDLSNHSKERIIQNTSHYPFRTIGIAAGLGFFLGLLWRNAGKKD